ncbi:MAG: thiamine-phosphate kinase, partial [Deltaproteobacteria bacterium]|nr:thiamine-phosphate kinase [Deltaproteobacteria bacterium]
GHGVSLIGGNTSASRRDMNITTTILGETPPEELVLRKGARPGELIFVTGSLGDSGLGLKALKSGYPKKTYAHAIKKHLDPEARVLAGRLLAKKRIPTAMTDISDGLIADLKHIMDQGRVGAEVFIEKLPLSDSLKKHLPNGLKLALTGGEDYELLFTAAEEKTLEIKRFSDKLGLPITAIGQITGRTQVLGLIDNKGRSIKLRQDGFEHFALPRR